MTLKLDFRNCKTPEDVEKVFAGKKDELDAIRKTMSENKGERT